MGNTRIESYDPYKEMKEFYRLDDPTADEQFRFVEAMEYLIENSPTDDDIAAFSFNLAMYYRDIKDFRLEKKYLDICSQHGSEFGDLYMGFIWYYGLCGECDYEKAYKLFEKSNTRQGRYMIADMYHEGKYVRKDNDKCREILEELLDEVEPESNDDRFLISTLYPEIIVRLVRLNIEEEEDTEFDLNCLFEAREILSNRQGHRPFWGNIKTMKDILDTTVMMCGNDFDFVDLYDLLTFTKDNATVLFYYDGKEYSINIMKKGVETIYEFGDKWFHGAEDFLEKGRLDGQRITSLWYKVSNIKVTK